MSITSTTIAICSLTVACLSFILSGLVAWFTIIWRGKLRMTRPAMIVFMHDILADGEILPKIFLRTLLYTTGNKGHVIEAMYLRIHRGEGLQTFNIWGHAERNDISLGSGLRVGSDGVVYNHHFNPPKHAMAFEFLPGDYRIEIYADLADSGAHVLLSRVLLTITNEQADALKNPNSRLFYEWGPESKTYTAHVETRPDIGGFLENRKQKMQ